MVKAVQQQQIRAPAIQGYRPTARLLHWLVALLVLLTLPVGQTMIMEGLPRSLQDTLFIFHKNVGVIILLLVIWRIAFRLRNPPPPLPASVPEWQQRVAAASHLTLYALLILMPVTGYVRVRAGGFPIEGLDALGVPPLMPRSDAVAEIAQTIHFYGRYALVAVIVLHVSAAIFHAAWLRDGVFARMGPPFRRRAPPPGR
jgi:cytochrome b561